MNHSLSEFRDIVLLLFRVVRNDAYQSHDLNILVNKIHDALASLEESTPVYLPIRETSSSIEFQDTSTPPTLVIHPDQDVGEIVPNVVVTKEEPDIRNLVVNLPAVVKAIKMETPVKKQTQISVPASAPAPAPTPMTSPHTVALPGPPSLMATTYKLDSDVTILKDLARDDESEPESDEVETEEDVEASEDEGEATIVDADIEEDEEVEDDDEEEAEAEAEEEEEAEAEAEDEEEEEAEEEEAEAEAEDEEEEEAEEEEEDDDLELLKIKKQRYYWSPSSTRIYEFLEEGYGDCLGTYVDGKIIPKA